MAKNVATSQRFEAVSFSRRLPPLLSRSLTELLCFALLCCAELRGERQPCPCSGLRFSGALFSPPSAATGPLNPDVYPSRFAAENERIATDYSGQRLALQSLLAVHLHLHLLLLLLHHHHDHPQAPSPIRNHHSAHRPKGSNTAPMAARR